MSRIDKIQARHERELAEARAADAIEGALPEECPAPRFVHARELYGVKASVSFGDQHSLGGGYTLEQALAVARALPANAGGYHLWTDGCAYTVPAFHADDPSTKAHASRERAAVVTGFIEAAPVYVVDSYHGSRAELVWLHSLDLDGGTPVEVSVAIDLRHFGHRQVTYKEVYGERVVDRDEFHSHGLLTACEWERRYASGSPSTPRRHVQGWYEDSTAPDVTPESVILAALEREATR